MPHNPSKNGATALHMNPSPLTDLPDQCPSQTPGCLDFTFNTPICLTKLNHSLEAQPLSCLLDHIQQELCRRFSVSLDDHRGVATGANVPNHLLSQELHMRSSFSRCWEHCHTPRPVVCDHQCNACSNISSIQPDVLSVSLRWFLQATREAKVHGDCWILRLGTPFEIVRALVWI